MTALFLSKSYNIALILQVIISAPITWCHLKPRLWHQTSNLLFFTFLWNEQVIL